MKNLSIVFMLLLIISAFVSCGDDDSTQCTQSDFVGTYTLVGDSTCTSDNSILAPLTFSLTAGSTDNTVLENGEEDLVLTILDCNAKDDFISYTKDGNNLTSKIGECEWTYTKN